MQSVTLHSLKMVDKIPLQQLANNINIAKNLRTGFPNPYSLTDAEAFIKKNMETQKNDMVRAIKYNNEFAGVTGLHNIKESRAELGFWLGEPYWGKGITTKAAKAILSLGINEFKLKQIYAYCLVNNIGSEKVLLKSGFKKIKTVDENCNNIQKGVKSFYFELDF